MQQDVHDNELQFFYFGFYTQLRRFRARTIAGWCVTILGGIEIPFGWGTGSPLDVVLPLSTIAAGIALVSVSISSLESYVTVPFPDLPAGDHPGAQSGACAILRGIMRDVDEGGWREAYAALHQVREAGVRFGLPPPD